MKKLALTAITLACLSVSTVAAAGEPSEITRQIGLDMLRQRMLEQIEQRRAIDWTPPGYFLIGYTVRVG